MLIDTPQLFQWKAKLNVIHKNQIILGGIQINEIQILPTEMNK